MMIIGMDVESVFGVVSDEPAGYRSEFETDQLQSIPLLLSIPACVYIGPLALKSLHQKQELGHARVYKWTDRWSSACETCSYPYACQL